MDKKNTSDHTQGSALEPIVINENFLDELENRYKQVNIQGIVSWVDSVFVPGRKIIKTGDSRREGIISNREIVKVNKEFKATSEYILPPLPKDTSNEETFSTWLVPYVDSPFAVRVKTTVPASE